MTRVIILDTEAMQAISDENHPKHAEAISYAELTRQRKKRLQQARVVVPTCVRVEAALDHRKPASAAFNRFGIDDIGLDQTTASVAAHIRCQHGAQISVTDAHLGATVLQRFANDDVTIITSDPADMALVSAPVDVNVITI